MALNALGENWLLSLIFSPVQGEIREGAGCENRFSKPAKGLGASFRVVAGVPTGHPTSKISHYPLFVRHPERVLFFLLSELWRGPERT
jgi:hypothetical protein